MNIRILLLGVTEALAGALAREGPDAGAYIDVASGPEDALARVVSPATRYDAVVVNTWENASGVTKRLLAQDGRIAVHLAPAEPSRAGDLVRAIAASARARAERQQMLLAMIAHDVRAPIGVAIGAVSELGHPALGALDDEQRMLVKLASRSLARLQKTALNLSLLARIEAGLLELTRAPADVAELVREAARRVEKDREHGEARIELDASPAVARVDRERLALAFENVLANAVRFAKARVDVRVASGAGGVTVVVDDDGPGLPSNVADHFDRVGAALARASKTGSGFGLAVVRGVLVAHGGEARADDILEGDAVKGARITLRLPSA